MNSLRSVWNLFKPKQRIELLLCQTGNQVLRQSANPVNPKTVTTPECQELMDRMVEMMRKTMAVGLAAPQVGVSLRIICMECTQNHLKIMGPERAKMREMTELPLVVLANPVLQIINQEQIVYEEGCLSVAGYMAKVPRARQVKLSGLNRDGIEELHMLDGWSARIAQHEMDHLDGVLYIDKMVPKTLQHVLYSDHIGFGEDIKKYEKMLKA